MKGASVRVKVQGHTRDIGVIRDNTFLVKKEKEHFVQKYQGFGISKRAWVQDIRPKCDKVKVIYTKEDGTQTVYTASVSTWDQYGVEDKLGDFEPQVFLSTSHMDVKGRQ